MTIRACSADSLELLVLAVVVGLQYKEAFLKVLALCFCGRHAGDQGSERADRAGPEPPGSLGAPLFNHRAAKQSDGELHMPLVSAVSFCLGLHLSRFASLTCSLCPPECRRSSLGPPYSSQTAGRARLHTAARGDPATAPARTSRRALPEGSNCERNNR